MDDPSKLEHQETDNVLDDLEWDRPEILETAWAKTQSARPLAAKTFGGSRRTAMSLQRSNTLPLLPGDNVGCLTDSSPEFSRSSGRSFLSDHSSSESFVPPAEVAALPRRTRRGFATALGGSVLNRPLTSEMTSMDASAGSSMRTCDTQRETSTSSSNGESMYEVWLEKNNNNNNSDVTEARPPPRPSRRRHPRSQSLTAFSSSSRHSNQLCRAFDPFSLSEQQMASSPQWQERAMANFNEATLSGPPMPQRIRHPRSHSMFGSTSHPDLSLDRTSNWEENLNPNRLDTSLAFNEDIPEHRKSKKFCSRLPDYPPARTGPLAEKSKSTSDLPWPSSLDSSPPPVEFTNKNLSENSLYPSPARSVASSRKRGVCGSPLREVEDWFTSSSLSLLSTNSTRRSRILSLPDDDPPPFAPSLQRAEMDVDSDDGDDESSDSPNISFVEPPTYPTDKPISSKVKDASTENPEYILETMSSYDDLKFLIKSLRKEANAPRLPGMTVSWNITPAPTWSSNRRSAFYQWTVQDLGFSVRAIGATAMFVQIPKSKGEKLLHILEGALIQVKKKERILAQEASDIPPFTLSTCRAVHGTVNMSPQTGLQNNPSPTAIGACSPLPSTMDDEAADLVSGLQSMTMQSVSSTKNQGLIRTVTVEPQSVSKGRASFEHHAPPTDLMSHIYGVSPCTQLTSSRRQKLSFGSVGSASSGAGKQRSSLGSNHNMRNSNPALVEPMNAADCYGTPIVSSGWGSNPVPGRDWGGTTSCDIAVLNELSNLLKTSCDMDEEGDSFGFSLQRSSNLALDLLSTTGDLKVSDMAEVKPSQIAALSPNDGKLDRRRRLSYAKMKRMSLWVASTHPTELLIRKPKNLFLGQKSYAPAISEHVHQTLSKRKDSFLEEHISSSTEPSESDCANPFTTPSSDDLLRRVFSFLTDTELLCKASSVCHGWADVATSVNVDRIVSGLRLDEDDEESSQEVITSSSERSWGYLHNLYPWACFLSEGSFKKVYMVHNAQTACDEAVSVMDVEEIVDKRAVAAELVVSVMLSSLARRAICPNFIITRSVFTSRSAPSESYWGNAVNKKPHGTFVKGRLYNVPPEPRKTYPGRYQYIRMELCNEGDTEEFLKRQEAECLDGAVAQAIVFQIAFALHAAADKFSVKHYDIKLLNVFLHRYKDLPGPLILRYGLGCHTFALQMPASQPLVAKIADYGTANISPQSTGQPVTIAQFTTIENTPPDFFILGDQAKQGHGHDCFALGLCMLHLFTGHAPYEEIMDDVRCPASLKKKLRQIWENENVEGYSVLRSVILSDVFKDEMGHIIDGEPDETPYDTLYRFLVLFGIPELAFEQKKCPKVWKAIFETLQPSKLAASSGKPIRAKQCSDAMQFKRDCRKYSILDGTNKYISRARKCLQAMNGGIDLLLRLCSFDPSTRASAIEVLNSTFMVNLREPEGGVTYTPEDTVFSFNSFSTHR